MKQDNNQKYEITILNWDKYQRPLRGAASSRRSWIAISVDLYSDPDFLDMKSVERECWIGLLLHAGKVGAVFELGESRARVMLQLRHSPDFSILVNQGFIECRKATNIQTNKTDTILVAPAPEIEKKKKPKAKKTAVRFEGFWDVWPKGFKSGRTTCETKWKSKDLDKIADKIIADVVKRAATDRKWLDKFIPNPLTYLNQERWNDDIQTADLAPAKPNRIKIPQEDHKLVELCQQNGISTKGKYRQQLENELRTKLEKRT